MAENVDARPGDDFARWVATTRVNYIGQDLRENSLTYIPDSELTKYWSIQKINKVLRSYDKPLPFDAAIIIDAYLRIFSALVFTATTRQFLGLILTDGLDDSRWPLVDPPTSWDVQNRGADADFEKLKKAQWIFFPHRFETHRLHKTLLDNGCILPIELETIVQRGESLVHKIKINDDYNGLTPDPKGRFFALKQYELKHAEDRYDTEVEALTMLRQSPSKNLVTFYGSFRKDGQGFIILDFADGGDLKEFFENTPPPATVKDIQIFWESLTMSLQGLDRIHQLMSVDNHMKDIIQGIHQDIKPANILLMKGLSGSPYDFQPKIANFGSFSRARKSRSNSDEAKGPNKHGNQIYSAPEVSANVRNRLKGISLITPSADIFSFGAVLSVAAAYVAGGQQLVSDYFDRRKAAHTKLKRFSKTDFEGCFHAGIEKFPVIDEMHNRIKAICQNNKRHDGVTPQILDVVQQHMLLPKSSERDQASTLIDRFNHILFNEPSSPTISLSTRRRSTWMTASSDGGEITATSPSIRTINNYFDGSGRSSSWMSSRTTDAENSKVLDSTVKNLIDQITRNLRDRDQFFFIDDSTSMRQHQRIVLEGFQALSSIAKQLDPNRVELAFASRPLDVHRARSTRKLVKVVRDHQYEHNPARMANSLSTLIEHQIIPRLPVKKAGFNINPVARKQVSVYIFTDGMWGDDPDKACHVEDAVQDLMDEVRRRRLSRQQVTLHFVRFGDSEAGVRHLDYLDRFGEKDDHDIVDVKHISSNVESIFVGPLSYENDRKGEVREGVPSVDQMSTLDLDSTEPQKITTSNVSDSQTSSDVNTEHITEVFSNSQPYQTSTIPSSLLSGSSNQHGASHEGPKNTIQTIEELDDVPDDVTIYTQNSSDTDSHDVQYQRDLADEIHQQVSSLTTNNEDFNRIGECLERILQTFALKFAKEGEKKEYKEISKFLYRHRKKIAAKYCAKEANIAYADDTNSQSSNESISMNEEREPEMRDPSNPQMTAAEKATRWFLDAELDLPPDLADDETIGTEPAPDAPDAPDVPDVSDVPDVPDVPDAPDVPDVPDAPENEDIPNLVRNSHAHKWLLAALARELDLIVPTPSATSELSEHIFKAMRKHRPVSRQSPMPMINATFVIEWSPHTFLAEQEYGVPPSEAISKALVLVGTTSEVEGVSCCEYLFRTWPDTSQIFLGLIKSIVRSPEGTKHDATFEDGTEVHTSMIKGVFSFNVSGFADTVIEVGEQVMWISCALRESGSVEGPCYVYPTIRDVSVSGTTATSVSLRVDLSVAVDLDEKNELRYGQCWFKMFRNPVVVKGFPIPRIPNPSPGLRLAFNTVMLLMPDSRLSTYRGKIFIKRFSTLLVAVKQVGNTISWHTISKDNGSYIYYHDSEVLKQKVEVDTSVLNKVDITTLTHIIGWTTRADDVTGTHRANLAIRGCGLGSRKRELELEKFTVGFSHYLAANVSVKAGNRDKPILYQQNGDYHESVKFISHKFVVLYDTEDQRGFLLDGSSVLLHLVMSSLDQEEKESTLKLGTHGNIQFHKHIDPRVRSMQTLLADENIRLPLYHRNDGEETKTEVKHAHDDQQQPVTTTTTEEVESRKGSWASLKDRVLRIYSLLDQGLNMNTDESVKMDLKQLVGYQQLEGYDFRDLACSNKAKLRVAQMKPGGEAWLDLVRGLSALTLFGRGFGELIRNGERGQASPYLCQHWESVPKHQGYLSMSNSTLARILAHHGNFKTSELIEGLHVKCPRDLFQACLPNAPRCGRAHILVRGHDKKAPMLENLPENGAIIIGRDESRSISRLLGRERSRVNQGGHLSSVLSTNNSNTDISTSAGTSVGPSYPRSDVSAGLSRSDTPLTSLCDDTIGKTQLPRTELDPYSSEEVPASEPSFPNVPSANHDTYSTKLQLSTDAQQTSSSPRKQPAIGSDTAQKPQGSHTPSRKGWKGKHVWRWLFRRDT